MKKVNLKEARGITLVALVITMIVLLILAAVSINLVMVENGLIKKVQLAKQETQEKKLEEERKLQNIAGDINELSGLAGDATPGKLSGAGTEEAPFLIESIEDLCAFSDLTNQTDEYGFRNENLELISKSDMYYRFKDQYVIQTVDLNFCQKSLYALEKSVMEGGLKDKLLEQGFISISNYEGNTGSCFAGVFNGNNKKIDNIYINLNKDEVGLFGEARDATIKNVLVSGKIQGSDEVGGIVGFFRDGEIINCKNYATITTSDSEQYSGIGGIIGVLSYSASIIDCVNYGEVHGVSKIGGICGAANFCQKIEKCKNYGYVKAEEGEIGGIAGNNTSVINYCMNSGIITGDISTSTTAQIGGIAGYNSGEILGCYNRGDVNGKYYVAGLVGANQKSILNSYNIGKVIATSSYKALVVVSNYSNATIKNVFALSESGIVLCPNNLGTIGEECVIKTEDELQEASFVGFLNKDLTNKIWIADTKNINNGYPIFNWQ